MEKKGFVQLGGSLIDLRTIAKDARGMEDRLAEVIKADWAETYYKGFDVKLYPFAEAADIADWDQVLLDTYPPLYTDRQGICRDCSLGPCELEKGKGKCGLELESFQGKLGLRMACRGCLSQMMDSRELLNYAIKVFGGDKEVSLGPRHDITDHAVSIGVLTGLYVKNLDELDKALSYAEAQLNKLFLASYSGTGDTLEFEGMTFHAGSLLVLAMEAAELVKTGCFGLVSSDDHPLEEMNNWPAVSALGGLGNVERGKPVIAFLGDNFLSAWVAINYLKEKELTGQIEICGLGPVGHDILRFYDKCRIISTQVMAAKAIRTGFADVVVASNGCVPVDVLGEARRVESKVIWTSAQGIAGLKDRTEDSVDRIVKDLIDGAEGAWIRDAEKAGEIAVRVAKELKRKGDYLLSGEAVKKEAGKCKEDCDLCFNVCPNSLLLGRAIRKVKDEGLKALVEVEEGCTFCGKCEEVCPENIPLRDLIVATKAERAAKDKFVMRPGRGPIPRLETMAGAFGALWGNCPGFVVLMGCGGTKYQKDIGWIAHELTAEGCFVVTTGCGSGEVAQYYNEEEQKFIFDEFHCEYQPRNLLNCGACSASCYLRDIFFHYSRTGAHISHYANFAPTADLGSHDLGQITVMWGVPNERMFALATAFARGQDAVVVGPESAFEWKRFLLGNVYDRSKWRVWDANTGRSVETEPVPAHFLVPVETKEEAVTMAFNLMHRPFDPWDARHVKLDSYVRFHEENFGELPDDWQFYVRSHTDLPPKLKAKLLKELQDKYGWKVERLIIKKARHRNGELMTLDKFHHEYSTLQAPYFTRLARLLSKAAKQNLAKEGVEI